MIRGRVLTSEQRRTYMVGWLNWMGAETVGVVLAVLNLIWVPIVVFGDVAVPEAVLTIPILIGFAIYLVHFMSLYQLRVKHSLFSTVGAAFAAMALQFTVARAVGEWVWNMAFIRTAKGGNSSANAFPAFWEAVMGGLLVAGGLLVYAANTDQVVEMYLFSTVLFVQALPFLAAAGMAAFERTPLNDPAYIAQLRTRVAAFADRRRVATTPALTAEPAATPVLPRAMDDIPAV
jgi:hypothetical protein